MSSTEYLQWLLAPISLSDFFESYWEKKPLLISRSEPKYWSELLTKEDLERIMCTTHLRYPEISLAHRESPVSSEAYADDHDVINISKVFQYFADGHTIIFNYLNRYIDKMAEMCRMMEVEFSSRFQTNIYLTPKNSQGFQAHYDSHCVFIIQIKGSKTWRLYNQQVKYPTKDYLSNDDDPGLPSQEFELKAGDILYIPRGLVHDANTKDSDSIHITLGALVYTWADTLPEILKSITLRDESFRKSLPLDFISPTFDNEKGYEEYASLINKLLDKSIYNQVMAEMYTKFMKKHKPVLQGQFNQLQLVEQLLPSLIVKRKFENICKIKIKGDFFQVIAHEIQLNYPINLLLVVKFMINTEEFKIRDIPCGEYVGFGLKRKLIKQLIKASLIKIVEPN